MISPKKLQILMEESKYIRDFLSCSENTSTMKRSALDENTSTLDELDLCLSMSSESSLASNLTALFSRRWERISNSSYSYLVKPANKVNQLCLDIAKILVSSNKTGGKDEEIHSGIGAYFLLMPGIDVYQAPNSDNIEHCELFLLDANVSIFIPLLKPVAKASEQTEKIPLISAVKKGDLEALRMLLTNGVDIEARDINACTALYWAAYKGHIVVLNQLLQNGAAIEACNDSALHYAVLGGNQEIVDTLLDNNADINVRNLKGQNALDIAIERQHADIIKKILLKAVFLSVNQQRLILKNVEGYSSIFEYVSARQPQLLYILLDTVRNQSGTEVITRFLHSKNKDGKTPLISAVGRGDFDTTRLLLELGAAIEATDSNKSTALHWAASNGHLSVLNLLLEKGARMDSMGLEGYMALNFAMINNQKAIIETLVALGAINIKNRETGITPLIIAAATGDIITTKALVKAGADIEAFDVNKNTALHWAAKRDHVDVATYLIENNADIAVRDINSKNVIDLAAPAVTEKILLKAATLGIEQQRSLLAHIGAYRNVLEYVVLKRPKLIETFKKELVSETKNTLLNAKNERGHTALFDSIQNGDIQTVTRLLNLGADINTQNHDGNTALIAAIRLGNVKLISCLLKANADITVRNNKNQNALDSAIETGNLELIKIIVLKAITLSSAQQKTCLKTTADSYDSILSYVMCEQPDIIDSLLKLSGKAQQYQDSLKTMKQFIDIDAHIKIFQTKLDTMQEKVKTNTKYLPAVAAAQTLIKDVTRAKARFLFSEGSIEEKKSAFKKMCLEATENARPVLKTHRDWVKVISAFIGALLILPVSLALLGLGVFSTKTKSEQLLNTFAEVIKDVDSPENYGSKNR